MNNNRPYWAGGAAADVQHRSHRCICDHRMEAAGILHPLCSGMDHCGDRGSACKLAGETAEDSLKNMGSALIVIVGSCGHRAGALLRDQPSRGGDQFVDPEFPGDVRPAGSRAAFRSEIHCTGSLSAFQKGFRTAGQHGGESGSVHGGSGVKYQRADGHGCRQYRQTGALLSDLFPGVLCSRRISLSYSGEEVLGWMKKVAPEAVAEADDPGDGQSAVCSGADTSRRSLRSW